MLVQYYICVGNVLFSVYVCHRMSILLFNISCLVSLDSDVEVMILDDLNGHFVFAFSFHKNPRELLYIPLEFACLSSYSVSVSLSIRLFTLVSYFITIHLFTSSANHQDTHKQHFLEIQLHG